MISSYVICNGYGDVLRSSAAIAKSRSEIIAQVRDRAVLFVCFDQIIDKENL